jgi:DNA-binding YbaB/EbfC family protein
MPDFQQLLQLSQQMQGNLQQLDHDLQATTHVVEAGGGLVRVGVDGRGMVRTLWIDPVAFEGRDAELLGDLVLSAIAEAQRRAGEALQQAVRRVGPSPAATPFPLP